MKKLLVKLYYRIVMVRLALRWVRRFNLGDEVIHNGKRYTLIQGVCRPYWDLAREDYTHRAHESAFRKVRSLRNYWRSFSNGYGFYRAYWFDIWVNNGIEDWMRGCNIWGGKKPL